MTLSRFGARVAPITFAIALSLASSARRVEAQLVTAVMPTGIDDRSGPRFGIAVLTAGSVTAEQMNRRVAPVISLLGWQIEHQFDSGRADLPVPMTELVFMVGGLEQSVALPSVSWIVGFRQTDGVEGGFGALMTPAGSSLILAGGVTRVVGNFNVPINLAVAPGRRGVSISLTTGFNERRFRRGPRQTR